MHFRWHTGNPSSCKVLNDLLCGKLPPLLATLLLPRLLLLLKLLLQLDYRLWLLHFLLYICLVPTWLGLCVFLGSLHLPCERTPRKRRCSQLATELRSLWHCFWTDLARRTR